METWGPFEKGLKAANRRREKRGKTTLPVLDTRTRLTRRMSEVFSAFLDMCRTRSYESGQPLGISYQEITSYLDLCSISSSESRKEFSYHISVLDRDFISKARAKNRDRSRERSHGNN